MTAAPHPVAVATAGVFRKRAAALREEAAFLTTTVERKLEDGTTGQGVIVPGEARTKLRTAVLFEACARDAEKVGEGAMA